MSVNETISEQLQRAHDLIEEAISVIEDVREGTHYKPGPWFAHAETHARAAKRDIRKGLKGLRVTRDIGAAAAD